MFNVGVPTFSSNTTIRADVGIVIEVNVSEIIVDVVVEAGVTPVAVNNTYPSKPETCVPAKPALFVPGTYKGLETPPPTSSDPAVVEPDDTDGFP